MRSARLRFSVCAILLAGLVYGQDRPPTERVLEEGDNLYAAIITFSEDIVKCVLTTSEGRIVQFKPIDESDEKFKLLPDTDVIRCHVMINNVDENDNGLWTLLSESKDGTVRTQAYSLTVNPKPDPDRSVEYLKEEIFDTNLDASHTVAIPNFAFVTSEKCSIITPDGRLFNLEGLKLNGVEVITYSDNRCAVKIDVTSEENVGRWMLISDGTRYSDKVERRLPFTLRVEEIVPASVSELTVVQGNDFYIRLKNSIPNYDSCRLMGPGEKLQELHDLDSRYAENCGYIIRNVNASDSGKWEILYGNRITYRASTHLTVTEAATEESQNLIWKMDRSVKEIVGPNNAVYCQVVSPAGQILYDGFGRCNINIERVTMEHDGSWTIHAGLPGRVLTEEMNFTVRVVQADPKPKVTTLVNKNMASNTVSLSCSVSSPHPVRSCKFRDPSGRVLLANEGVGESRYSFHGAGVSYQSGVHTHDCGLLITGPVVKDMGLWRCAVETEHETYYGFLTVLCPWNLRDPEVAAEIVTEPYLTADRREVSGITGESVSMSCFVDSAIRYCYFRARNGTVFNVGPNDPHDQATYVGAGFDAGECGIRFQSLAVSDSGSWSCHVGLVRQEMPEQRATIELTIYDSMVANQRTEGEQLIMEAQVHDQRALEYCRFVRIDGLGFTNDNLPENYENLSDLATGKCGIAMRNPSIMENHPWTVVARIQGQEMELSRSTDHTLELPGPGPGQGGGTVVYRIPLSWIIVMAIGLSLLLAAVLVGPKRNRDWAFRGASSIRSSFLRKTTVQNEQQNISEKTTAMAA